MSLRQRIALVTGGQRGLCKGIAAALGREGTRLAIEESPNGIKVNEVNPSNLDEKELTLAEARRICNSRYLVGRSPTADDVAPM